MAEKHGTAIGWTHHEGFKGETWNPVTGCSKVSPGCAHCYAETVTDRYAGRPGWIEEFRPWTPANAGHNVRLWPKRLEQPLRWRKPRMVFVNSMSDLFHELVPDEYIACVFDVIAAAPQHVFQILTKRPERMRDCFLTWQWARPEHRRPLPNAWLGVSIENRRYVGRADVLRETPATVRFISAEPLLGPLVARGGFFARGSDGFYHPDWPDGYIGDSLSLDGIDWLIAGGESGTGHRPMRVEWVRDLRDKCEREGTAFFFKQWGGRTPGAGGRELDDRTWDEWPALESGVVDAAAK